MTVARDPLADTPQRPRRWRDRLLTPIRAQLTRGITPDRIALTLGIGTACSLFPFLGFTSLLNLLVGSALRLNHGILQALNQLLGPLQLALIYPFVRAGEILWGATSAARFTVSDMVAAFHAASLTEFLTQFGRAGLHALTAWLVAAPLLAALTCLAARPALRRVGASHA